jgi:RNA polymerase-interacting CarD/CdnL/TRCF family regulator
MGEIIGRPMLDPQSLYNTSAGFCLVSMSIRVIVQLSGDRSVATKRLAEQLGLSSLVSSEAIIDVLSGAPQSLTEDPRLRKTEIAQKMESGDPLAFAEVLRDLTWRGHTVKLSGGDIKLKGEARRLLSSILAARPSTDTRSASQRLDATLKHARMAWDMPA